MFGKVIGYNKVDTLRIIHVKLGWNWSGGFRGENLKKIVYAKWTDGRTAGDGNRSLDPWVKWAKIQETNNYNSIVYLLLSDNSIITASKPNKV